MSFDELKQKANTLPLSPGVYIMRDSTNTVIYIGKAKKLKNRVSQYFQDTISHSPKTKMMVSKIAAFDVIVAASEFEALVLECSLIKQHLPKYNILLKDDKGYPYIRLDLHQQYPRLEMVSKIANDKAMYFGPFGSRGVTQSLLESIRLSLKLPNCHRVFPRDIGKDRPCLNYHMNQCFGWCRKECDQKEYNYRIEEAKQLLLGNFKHVTAKIKEQMQDAAEDLNFELAASLRDRLKSIEALGQKQLVTAGGQADMDIIGFAQNDHRACFAVLHYKGGNLIDKEYEILSAVDEPQSAVSSLLTQYYLSRGFAPGSLILPFFLDDAELIQQLFREKLNRSVNFHVPQRGEKVQLVELACTNAREEVERITTKVERTNATLSLVGKMLNIPAPKQIESFDISNISGTDIVGSMVVFSEGKPLRDAYKRFRISDLDDQNDYASMQQVLTRRLTRLIDKDAGFETSPDLLLIDGGITHAQTAQKVVQSLKLEIPVFGMVKDDRHRTRALVTPEGQEIHIDANQSIFSFIGAIQEETHRFAINYHRQLRSKRLRYSELDAIAGIGPKRKQDLLKTFKSITGIKNASMDELLRILPVDAANNVFVHFHQNQER